MEASAKINVDYLWRTALFCIVFTGWGLWSAYDGLVAYPQFNEEHGFDKYEDLRTQCAREAMAKQEPGQSPYERRDAVHQLWVTRYRARFLRYLRGTDWWKGYEKGARTDEGAPRRGEEAVRQLEEEYHSTWDIRAQYLMAVVCLPLGLSAAIPLVRNLTRRFTADDEGLHGFAKEPIPYDAIREINRAKWERKGIAKLQVEQDGRTRTLTLDDWKFKGMVDILAVIEQKRPDLAPPPPPAEEEEQAAEAESAVEAAGETRSRPAEKEA